MQRCVPGSRICGSTPSCTHMLPAPASLRWLPTLPCKCCTCHCLHAHAYTAQQPTVAMSANIILQINISKLPVVALLNDWASEAVRKQVSWLTLSWFDSCAASSSLCTCPASLCKSRWARQGKGGVLVCRARRDMMSHRRAGAYGAGRTHCGMQQASGRLSTASASFPCPPRTAPLTGHSSVAEPLLSLVGAWSPCVCLPDR